MDNKWKSATKADRAALYHVARSVADTTNLGVEATMEKAFSYKLMVGTDYPSCSALTVAIPSLPCWT